MKFVDNLIQFQKNALFFRKIAAKFGKLWNYSIFRLNNSFASLVTAGEERESRKVAQCTAPRDSHTTSSNWSPALCSRLKISRFLKALSFFDRVEAQNRQISPRAVQSWKQISKIRWYSREPTLQSEQDQRLRWLPFADFSPEKAILA